MPDSVDAAYFTDRANQAREMAERATTPAARTIHLALASDYDQKAIKREIPPADIGANEAKACRPLDDLK